jgi:hypothetical protein
MNEHTTGAGESWGQQSLTLVFAGLSFRIEGLSENQCPAIRERFDLSVDGDSSSDTVHIDARRMVFKERSIHDYDKEITGYSPEITELDAGVWIDGHGFRARIQFAPQLTGTLYAQSETRLSHPMVFENFLRIMTAFLAVRRGGVLLHSSAVVRDGRAWLFVGRSGAGKTTIARKALAVGHTVLSDDGNLLLPDENGQYCAGPVPFAGELGQVPCTENRAFPVAAICWLNQAEEVALTPLTPALGFSRIMVCSPTANTYSQPDYSLDNVLLDLMSRVPVFQLDNTGDCSFEDVYALLHSKIVSGDKAYAG